MKDRANLQLTRRKVRDRSVALLLVGIVLLLPPVGAVSLIDGSIADLPIPLVYVFCVWLLLIGGAALLSSELRDSDETIGDQAGNELDD